MRLLDRYLLRHFLVSYLVCLASFLALYVVIDLFTKLDEFAEAGGSGDVAGWLQNVGVYYLYRLPWFFQRLSAVLSLIAGMFTLAWLERQNELLPVFAAGIAARRLLLPLLLAVLGVIGIALANQELIVPKCAAMLVKSAEDPRGKGGVCPVGCYDDRQIHFEGRFAFPQRQMIQYGRVTVPPAVAGRMIHLTCKEMFYRPASGKDPSGWLLRDVTPPELECNPPLHYLRKPGRFFIETELSYERLTRNPAWFHYESTAALLKLLESDDQLPRRAEVIALLHRRLTAPLLEFILVLLGIPFVLGRPGARGLYFKIGLCLALYALFQGVQYVCANLAQKELLDPVLGAWLPVFVFGPLALALLDGVRS